MKYIPLIILLLLSTACAPKQPVYKHQTIPEPASIQAAPNWFTPGKVFKIRHDGILRIGDSTLPMSGMMLLDTRTRQAKVALFTGLGIKLVTLEVSEDSHMVLSSSPMAQGIPHFIEECAESIRNMFLIDVSSGDWSQTGTTYVLTDTVKEATIRTFFNPEGLLIRRAGVAKGQEWNVEYIDTLTHQDVEMPETIKYTGKGYTVTLRLGRTN